MKNNTPQPGQNTGVTFEPPKPEDFKIGAESGIAKTVRETKGWQNYLPSNEHQARAMLDTMACVSFSANNCIETLLNRELAKNRLPQKHKQFLQDNGYIEDGKVNLSDRYLAKASGTTAQGNSLIKVADTFRHKGAVPEKTWPWPDMDASTPLAEKRARYYAEIPEYISELGRQFAELFNIQYQWVTLGQNDPTTLAMALLTGPIQIASSVCNPWTTKDNAPAIAGCGCGTGHATMIYKMDEKGTHILDHYQAFKKTLAKNYCIPYSLQYDITPKKQPHTGPSACTPPEANLRYGMSGIAAIKELQKCLQAAGFMRKGLFGPYGPATRRAVAQLQKHYFIRDWPQGQHYGPQTRRALKKWLKGDKKSGGIINEITPTTMTKKTFTNEEGVKMIEIVAPFKPLAERIAKRFARGFVAGALAAITTITVAAPVTLQDAGTILASAIVATIIGGITGGLQALDKWIREKGE